VSVSSLVRAEMAAAMAAALVLGLLLLALRPHDRPRVRNTLLVLGLCAAAEIADGLMVSAGGQRAAAIVADIASVLIGLVLARLATIFVFRVLLPALRLAPARIAEDITAAALYVGWVFAWLRMSGIDPASLFATSAVVTAVVAFAMQDTLGNVLGGVLLQVDRSIRVGDWVRVDDVSGQVMQIHWRHTAIETRNGETVVVPNGWMLKNRFMVLASRQDPGAPWRRWIRVSVELDASPGEVCSALEEAVRNARIDNVATEPAPSAVLMDIAARQGFYALRYWMIDRKPDDKTDSAVRAHVLAALARHGMKVGAPYNEQLEVKDNQAHRETERALEHARRIDALARVELFASLTDAERETLSDHLVYAPFAAGDVITRQGAVAHWLYLIISGRAEVWRETPAQRLRIAALEGGDIFGEMGMMTGASRSATVTAVTDVVCYRLDKAGFATILAARPDIADSMSKVLARRQQDLEGRVRESLPGTEHASAHHEAILGRIREFFGLADPAREDQAIVS
jgi:small-conductance mechanosensitive channel/CRP-like cAMP-binding protein